MRPRWLDSRPEMLRVLTRNDGWALGRGAVRCRPVMRKLRPEDPWFSHPSRQRAPWSVALWEYPDNPSHKIEMTFRKGEDALHFVRILNDWI